MHLLDHLAYEVNRGVRPLALYTTSIDERPAVERRLALHPVASLIGEAGERNINVFLGRAECIETLRRFSTLRLNETSDEEDFILGVMLGYDLCRQCERFNRRRLETPCARVVCARTPASQTASNN